MVAEFTEYQRKMWRWLSYVTVCTHQVDRRKNGEFIIRRTGPIRTFLYYTIWVNSIVKVIYLILTYHGLLKEVHFLDQMSCWDWFLCFFELLQESNMWYWKYPLYEVFAANWRIQEEVFLKLGSPKEMQKKILDSDKFLVVMHTTIVVVGCSALMVQFFTAPKYALNTFAIVQYDNWPLRIIFAFHEWLYMWHIWVHAASSVVIGQVFAVTYTHLFNEMTQILSKLSKAGKLKPEENDEVIKLTHHKSGESQHSTSSFTYQQRLHKTKKKERFIPDRVLEVRTTVYGTQYDILTLLHDYKKIMMAAKEFNNWAGKWVGGICGTLYMQFVSDVFMMIQMLKEPETDFMAVFFFFEDAFVGMFMMFRCFILMSRVFPASEGFLSEFKSYLQNDIPIRKYLRKYQRTLKIVAAKLGGHSTNPRTVPKAIHGLMNYYIAAGMYQRPVDRKT